MKASKGTEDILLIHAALVALTPLIPLPFVDDIVQSRLQRRMVQALADRRKLHLGLDGVAAIADDEGAVVRGIGRLGRRLALVPLRFVLRKLLLVLRGKAIVDLASRTYHRGFLVDAAFAHGLCAPAGEASPHDVRRAIDAVLATVPVARSPITHAVQEGLEASGRSLLDIYARLRGEAKRDVDVAIDHAAESLEGGPVEEMRRAIGEIPTAHFDELEQALLKKLKR